MRVAVIIAAAGGSNRYSAAGGLRHKLDEDLGGKPVLQRTVETFSKYESSDVTIADIIVAGPHDEEALREFRERHGDRLNLLGARTVKGGKDHRWQSVANALALVSADVTHVAVHDGARPGITFEFLHRMFEAAARFPAVIPAVTISDTVKRVETTEETFGGDDHVAAILGLGAESRQKVRAVSATIPRDGLMLIQTPQVFSAELIRRAYAQADLSGTDDASLVERLGERIVVVDGELRNLKITLPSDLDFVRAAMGFKAPEGRPAHKRF